MTLKAVVDLAIAQNPDLALSRLEEQKAQLGIRAAKEPLAPRIQVGSGLAYTYGFPLSIEGSAPSIVDVTAIRGLYNPRRSRETDQAKEAARGAGLETQKLREEVVLQAALLFLDLEKAVRAKELAVRQVDHLRKSEAAIRLRVEEGRELPLESKRAALAVMKARQRAAQMEGAAAELSRTLAVMLALAPGVIIHPALEERRQPSLPDSEEASVNAALTDNAELRSIESAALVKNLEARALRASRLPQINIVGKYGLFGKFNNYEDYFRSFQRNNGLIGMQFQVPLFADSAESGRAAQADVEASRIRLQLSVAKSRVEANTRKAWRRIEETELAREVARMDLDVARDRVGVVLAQYEEGKASLRQLEEARYAENERWLGLYDAQYEAERARLELLRRTHTLSAAIQ